MWTKNQKYAVIALIAIAIIGLAWYSGYGISKNGQVITGTTPVPTTVPVGSVPLTLNLPFLMFNGTSVAYTSASPTVMLFSATPSPQTLVGIQSSSSPYTLTGNVVPTGSYELLVAPSSTGTYGTLDSQLSGQGITVGTPSVISYEGAYWTEYPVSFANLGTLQGSTSITGTITMEGYTSETPTLTGLLNSTALPSSGVGSGTVTAYFSGWAGSYFGQGYKITRMQLIIGDNVTSAVPVALPSQAANATAYDNGQFALSSATIGMGNGVTMTTANNVWGGTSTAIVEIGNSNGATYLAGPVINEQFYGLPVLYGQSDSASGTLTINLNFKSNGLGSNTIFFALKIYYITPTGTIGTTACALSIS